MRAVGQLDDVPSMETAILYKSLCDEEDKELHLAFEALREQNSKGLPMSMPLRAEVLDGICDGIWVRIGLALSICLPMTDGWDEVTRSNLAKLLPDGTVMRNEAGKVMKPEGWKPPDLIGVMMKGGTVPVRKESDGPAHFSDAFAAHPLAHVFEACIDQALNGKGEKRHGHGTPFMEQPWLFHANRHGNGFLTGQAEKKLGEAQGFDDHQRWEDEMLGAINYMAMAVIHRRLQRAERLNNRGA